MVGLMDLHPKVERVAYNGADVDVYGISAKGVVVLLSRFPELEKMLVGVAIEREQLRTFAPDAIAAVIAAACGYPGDPEAEERASKMGLETQVDFLEAAAKTTFKDGIGPFVQRFTSLSEAIVVQVGKVQDLRSPPPPKPSAAPATPPSGT